MSYDGDGVYHTPPMRKSRARLTIEEHDRMGTALREHAPMSERVENRICAMSFPELFDHFRGMPDLELLRSADIAGSQGWSMKVREAISYEVVNRWRRTLPAVPVTAEAVCE